MKVAQSKEEFQGWLDELTQSLAPGLVQHHRLVSLWVKSPSFDAGLIAQNCEVVESVVPYEEAGWCGFKADVQALSIQAGLELQGLEGAEARLELLQADGARRYFHGRIGQISDEGSDGGLAGEAGGGLSRYRVVLEPWLKALGERDDSFVFKDLSTADILDAVFKDYQDLGAKWRFELADSSLYPKRSLCVQQGESDLALVIRLLKEEGWLAWFEHEGADGASMGSHTLVIADHAGAWHECPGGAVRFTQSGAVLVDAVQGCTRRAAATSAKWVQGSYDYRSLGLRDVSADVLSDAPSQFIKRDIPGQYAWETIEQGERQLQAQAESERARAQRWSVRSAVRALAPGLWFELREASGWQRLNNPLAQRLAILSVRHHARSNVGESTQSDVPLYYNHVSVQLLSQALRPSLAEMRINAPITGQVLYSKGQVAEGLARRAQTAVVVGLPEQPIHTDRDHRVRVQYHWQRGLESASRLAHPTQENAPADVASGTWVRAAEPLAGANWGAHFVPRVGQELLMEFVEGDVERGVALGRLYTGQGSESEQYNRFSSGGSRISGNAPAWFASQPKSGDQQAPVHHAAALSGIKTQELGESRTGQGGHNHLVFDDSDSQSRLSLGTTQAEAHLSLGHLIYQNLNLADNQRGELRGYGLELSTQLWGALRAGQGLLISAAGGAGGTVAGAPSLENQAAQVQLKRAQRLQQDLSQSAQVQQAKVAAEPAPKSLPMAQGVEQILTTWQTEIGGAVVEPAASEAIAASPAGGQGKTIGPNRPDILLYAPGAIGVHTPSLHVGQAGASVSLNAGQAFNSVSQGCFAAVVHRGIVLYTAAEVAPQSAAITQRGLNLHAASGKVSVQAQSHAMHLRAQQKLSLESTQGKVALKAPQKMVLVGAGTALELNGPNITCYTSGQGLFYAAQKVLTGPASSSSSLSLPKVGTLKVCESEALAPSQKTSSASPV